MQVMSVGRHLIFYLLMYFFSLSLVFLQQMFIPKSHKSACYLVFLLASVLGVEPLFTIYSAFTNDSVTQADFVVVSLSPFWPQNYKCETFVTFWYIYLRQVLTLLVLFPLCGCFVRKMFFRGKNDSLLKQKIVYEIIYWEKHLNVLTSKTRTLLEFFLAKVSLVCFCSKWPKCHFVIHFKKYTFPSLLTREF